MLDINVEIRKGIMFVRINGELSKKTISKWNDDVKDLIIDNEIRNVVFNVTNLKTIDVKGINSLLYSYEVCKKNKGVSLLCGLNDSIKNKLKQFHILNYIKEVDSELSALSIIKV